MNSRERRVDYRWSADRDAGFEKSTFIYDAEGRLIAVDYAPQRTAPPEPPPATPPES